MAVEHCQERCERVREELRRAESHHDTELMREGLGHTTQNTPDGLPEVPVFTGYQPLDGSLTSEVYQRSLLRYEKERQQHGKPIGKHQLVQQHIARIEMMRATSDAMIERAAIAKEISDDAPGDKEKLAHADFVVSEAKYWASNAAWEAVDRAVQVFGGRGWSELYRPFRHLQDVRVCRIYEGTDEIMQLKIASTLLGKGYAAFG